MRFKEIESMLDMQVSQQQHSQSLQQQSEQAAMDKEVGRDNLALKKEQNNLKRQDMKQSGSNSSGKSNKGRASKLV
jgi:hypothetical protein